jgi:hypothetical protein
MTENTGSKLKKRGIISQLEGLKKEDIVSKPRTPQKELTITKTDISIKRPSRHKFFRVVPGEEWEMVIPVVELKDDLKREWWLVHPSVISHLEPGDYKDVRLNLAYYQDGSTFLVTTGMPNENGELNKWHESFDIVISKAKEGWIRTFADTKAGCYKIVEPTRNYPDIKISEEFDMWDYVMIAFRRNMVDNPDHDVLANIAGKKSYDASVGYND